MSRKQWKVSKLDKEMAANLAEKFNIDAFTALLLTSRNIVDDESILEFLDTGTQLIDPFDIIDMQKAVDRINVAIFEFQKITIVGDYDADGVTSTAVLYSYLDAQGANVCSYIPNRLTEGYGLSTKIIDKLSNNGTELIITVDNGISCIKEVDYANELGIDVVITDHHKPSSELPKAIAVVDPHRKDCKCKFKDWAGVGVAYKLISAIEGGEPDCLLHHFADLIAIGTVADVVPLVGENRKLVKQGINLISKRERYGIDALLNLYKSNNININSTLISFFLAPRINAAGRMGDADKALSLLLSEDLDDAEMIAGEIEQWNNSRKETENEIVKSVEEKLHNNPNLLKDRIIVVDGENWHDGVIGIVASRILTKYCKPCIIITTNNDIAKASGRSIEGLDLFDALTNVKDRLIVFGGHSLAAGFSIKTEEIESFRKEINDYASTIEMPYPVQNIDCKLNPQFIDNNILEAISILEPFGAENPSPKFGLYEMCIDSITPVGDKKQHLKILMHKYGQEKKITIMKFETYACDFSFNVGDLVDLVVNIKPNEFLGEIRASASLIDIRLSKTDDEEMVKGIGILQKIVRKEKLTSSESKYALPTREEIGIIYRYIKQYGNFRYPTEILWRRLNKSDINYCKIAVSIEVLKEIGILSVNDSGHLIVPDNVPKTDLNNSQILAWIKTNT